LSATKKRKLMREEEQGEAKRQEQLKEERSLSKAAVTNQTNRSAAGQISSGYRSVF
jgi:hypothetical protein